MRKLSIQAGSGAPKVVYTKAGMRLSAAILDDTGMVVDHKAYWTLARSIEEARYLTALLNSAFVRDHVSPQQSRGEFNPRDLDKLVWGLPIPLYDESDTLHRDLAATAAKAEIVAASIELTEGAHFTAKRRAIRAALAADGIAQEIEQLVAALLGP